MELIDTDEQRRQTAEFLWNINSESIRERIHSLMHQYGFEGQYTIKSDYQPPVQIVKVSFSNAPEIISVYCPYIRRPDHGRVRGIINTPRIYHEFSFRDIETVFEYTIKNFMENVFPLCEREPDEEAIREKILAKTWNMDFEAIKDHVKRILDANGFIGRYTVSEDIASEISATQWISHFLIDGRYPIKIHQPYLSYGQQGHIRQHGYINAVFRKAYFNHKDFDEKIDAVMKGFIWCMNDPETKAYFPFLNQN